MSDKQTTSDIRKKDRASNDPAYIRPSEDKHDPTHEGVHNPEQLDIGERARQDAESDQVDTDLYNTSGNEAKPPKTADTDSASED